MAIILQLAINILIPTALFGLIAAGFSVFYAVSRVQHMAHGAVITSAGYSFLTALNAGWGVPLAVLIGVGVAVAVGLSCNMLIYERLQRRRWFSSLVALIASLILLGALQSVLLLLFGSQPRVIPLVAMRQRIELFGAAMTVNQLLIVPLCLFILGSLSLYLRQSRVGIAIRATADNPEVAEVIGINTRRIRYITMFIVSLLGGLAGILIALEYNLDPYASTLHGVRMFARTIVAGVGSIGGILVSGAIIDGAENIGGYVWSNSFKDLYSFILVFLFLLFRPRGLFGPKQ